MAAALAFVAFAAEARIDRIAGPVPAEVLYVVDGDTIRVKAHVWLGQDIETLVRLQGIDAPEMKGRCPEETRRAAEAREFLRSRLAHGPVTLTDIRFGKYAGRVLAQVQTPTGEDASAALLASGLARPYRGERRAGWCRAKE